MSVINANLQTGFFGGDEDAQEAAAKTLNLQISKLRNKLTSFNANITSLNLLINGNYLNGLFGNHFNLMAAIVAFMVCDLCLFESFVLSLTFGFYFSTEKRHQHQWDPWC